MENNKEKEEEVITFKELVERHKDIKKEELFKFVLVCKNCKFKGLLVNFIKDKSKYKKYREPYKDEPDDWNPKPKPLPYPYTPFPKPKLILSKTNKKINCLILDDEEYEDYFFCPKCGSSLVVLDKDFVKNNISRALE